MGNYVTTADMETYGITGSVVSSLIDTAEALFNTLIKNPSGLLTLTRTEDFSIDQTNGKVFFLRTYNPTTVTSINGISAGTINVNYTLYGNKLELKDQAIYPSDFPYRYRVIYSSGYAEGSIPNDVKGVIKQIVVSLYNRRKAEGISNFKQDLLSVSYDSDSILDNLGADVKNSVMIIANKYRIPTVI